MERKYVVRTGVVLPTHKLLLNNIYHFPLQHEDPNTRLAPGDMVSVEPTAIRFLQPSSTAKEGEVKEEAKEEAAEETVSEESSSTPDLTPKEPKPARSKEFKLSSLSKPGLTPFRLPDYASPFLFVPAYLEPSFKTCSVIYVRHPTARPGYSEVPTPYDADGEIVRFAWEWYAKRRPKIRSKSQKAREPTNRRSADEL